MTAGDLIKQLEKIVKVHPEAAEAIVYMVTDHRDGDGIARVIGYDTKHKKHRMNLMEY